MGRKYIIEIEDENFHQYSDSKPSEYLWRVKGFNSLVFDEVGLRKLTPYTEDSAYAHGYTEAESKYREIRDELEKQAYQRGYEAGYDDGYNEPGKNQQKAYEQEKEDIQVGDEVIATSGKAVVIEVMDDGQTVRYLYPDTITGRNKACNITRTGRHFPEIAEVLEKMNEGKEQ